MKHKIIYRQSGALIVAISALLSFNIPCYGQKAMNVFTAPASADALKNPVKDDPNATLAGKKTYATFCAACHGDKGKGDGVAATGLAKPPANHTSAQVQKVSDGGLFWMITNGNNPMPAYQSSLTELQRWQLVNFIRTLAKPSK